jgi:putative membrane protein
MTGDTKVNTDAKQERKTNRATVIFKPPDISADDRVFLAWQRSHMANERTFLAWCRTSISLLVFGFVIERFEIFLNHVMRLMQLQGEPTRFAPSSAIMYLSLLSFFVAGIAAVVSGIRFLRVRRHINRGEAVFSVLPDILVVLSVLVIVVITIVLALPRLFEMGGKIM